MIDDEIRLLMGKVSQVFQLVVEGPMQRATRDERREQTKAWLEELDIDFHKEDEVVMNMLVMVLARKYRPEDLFTDGFTIPLSMVISLFDLSWNGGRLYEQAQGHEHSRTNKEIDR